MRHLIICASLIICLSNVSSSQVQGQYFPPLNPQSQWDTLSPEKLGWCTEQIPALYEYLEKTNTKGYLLLYKGRIVLEKYFGDFKKDSAWYWASAGKTLTSFLIGKAQEDSLLSIEDASSKYLGEGWSSIPIEQERAIKIKHHLTMTTGLDDEVPDNDCTIDTCLIYLKDPGERWAYHNAPYTLLDSVIHKATGQNLNAYTQSTLKNKIGMTGLWVKLGFNNVYISNPRAMARYGHLILNNGVWKNDTIMKDQDYFRSMISRSQVLNPSYGYLWWLNGQGGYMLPGFQYFFNGNFAKEAPEDVVSGLGKNGQIVSFSKQHELVMVRMGNSPDSLGFVPNFLLSDIWKLTMNVACRATSAEESFEESTMPFIIHNDMLRFTSTESSVSRILIVDMNGRMLHAQYNQDPINVSEFPTGVYTIVISSSNGNSSHLLMKR